MKLKKIASLALAGVMAVSMLAGCATTKPETKPEEPTETTGISKEVGALVEDAPEYVTFADSAELDSALKAAVEYAGVKDVLPQYVGQDTLATVKNSEMHNKIYTQLSDDKVDWDTLTAIGWVNAKTDGKSAQAYELYAVSGNIGENAVKELVAEELEQYVDSYMEYDENGDNWYYDYTVSVSSCTKTVNSTIAGVGGTGVGAENPSVTFVAVQVVRTAAHQ